MKTKFEIDLMLPLNQMLDLFKRKIIRDLCAQLPDREQNRFLEWTKDMGPGELNNAIEQLQRSLTIIHLND